MHQKYLIRWLALRGGEFIVIAFYYYQKYVHQISVLIRGVVSLEGVKVYCHCILLFHCIRNLS